MQAGNRKAEGNEPRNREHGKDDAFVKAEVKTDTSEWLEVETSPGSKTLACTTWWVHGNSGGPAVLLSDEESMPNNRKKGGRQMGRRESDRLIVPEKAGNAAGGKEATVDRAE